MVSLWWTFLFFGLDRLLHLLILQSLLLGSLQNLVPNIHLHQSHVLGILGGCILLSSYHLGTTGPFVLWSVSSLTYSPEHSGLSHHISCIFLSLALHCLGYSS